MTQVTCHGCNKDIPQGNIQWFTPFPYEDRADHHSSEIVDTFATVTRERKPGSVPYCPDCLARLKASWKGR
jgi:hypothetical protein